MTNANVAEILDGAAEGLVSVPELLGFGESEAERLYDASLSFFERGGAAQAESILRWLVGAKPFVGKYWTAFGATLQVREDFVGAIRAYTTALAIDPTDVVALAHRGEACLWVGLVARGVEDLGAAAAVTDASHELAPWTDRARRLLHLHEAATAISNSFESGGPR